MSEENAPATEVTPPAAPAAPAAPTPPAATGLAALLEGLGDEAKTAILGEVSKARSEAKTLRDRAKAAETKATEYDKIQAEKQTETEKATAALKAATDQVSAANKRAVSAEVKALAAATFADPSDAVTAIDASKYIGADGEIDTEGITSALTDLLTAKPHWAKSASRVPVSPAQGSSANAGDKPAQLSREDLKGLSSAEIVKAQNEGRLNDLMGKR